MIPFDYMKTTRITLPIAAFDQFKPDWSQQARLPEWCVFCVNDVRMRIALVRRQTRIADDAVRPEIGDIDLQNIPGWLYRIRNFHAEGFGPQRPKGLPVQANLRGVFHVAKIEGYPRM